MDLVPVGNSPRVSFPVLKIVSSIRFAAISRASVCARVCARSIKSINIRISKIYDGVAVCEQGVLENSS